MTIEMIKAAAVRYRDTRRAADLDASLSTLEVLRQAATAKAFPVAFAESLLRELLQREDEARAFMWRCVYAAPRRLSGGVRESAITSALIISTAEDVIRGSLEELIAGEVSCAT